MDVKEFLFFFGLVTFSGNIGLLSSADPTDGFTPIPLSEHNFSVQRPYNMRLQDRYSYQKGVRRLWVYTNDKPLKPGSNTRPRTELRIKGLDYTSGIWQFEGYGYVPKGTSGVTIMQVFGAKKSATTIQLRIYNGELRAYNSHVVATDLYNKWFRLNVIHDVGEGKVTVFINGVQKLVTKDRGQRRMYFKCGVYGAPRDSSKYMESRWKNIKIYKK